MSSLLAEARLRFLNTLRLSGVLTLNANGVASNADKDSALSVILARGILERLGDLESTSISSRLAGQTSGNQFELICESFLKETFTALALASW